jgi:hypothetical protein
LKRERGSEIKEEPKVLVRTRGIVVGGGQVYGGVDGFASDLFG